MTSARSTLQLLALVFALAGVSRAQPIDRPLGGDAAQTATLAQTERETARVARTFYDAFVRGDVKTLERLYAPNVTFQDEIFTFSDRAGTIGMWRVLTNPNRGSRFEHDEPKVQGEVATVEWRADYELIPGRKIHNVITARLTIRNGVIVDHRDSFSWSKWVRQAFPLGGIATWKPAEMLVKFVMRKALASQAKKAAEEAAAAEAAASGAAPASPAPTPPSRGITSEITERIR